MGASLPAPFLGPKAWEVASGGGWACRILRPCEWWTSWLSSWGPAGGGHLKWICAEAAGLVVVPVQPPPGSRCGAQWWPDLGGFQAWG